jgi:aspartate kinase
MIQVFKFGGASVKDPQAVKNAVSIISSFHQHQTIVVVSAMGKMTNQLEQLVDAYMSSSSAIETHLQVIKDFHETILTALFDKEHPVFNAVENVFVELSWSLEDEPSHGYDHHYDQIVSQGEVLSSLIIAAYLNQMNTPCQWLDVRNVLRTDNTYREGKIDYDESQMLCDGQLLPLLNKQGIVVTQGFIGGTSENFTTTLGREGSDYTAALLAYFTNAGNVTIWKDVPGVLNADPKFFKNASKIPELNYQDAIELTYYGATVIHPKTIKPLQNKNIPLIVKSFLQPSAPGTLIHQSDKRIGVTSYIFKTDQLLLSIQPRDFSFIGEDNLSSIFSLFSQHHVHINVMQISAISFNVSITNDKHRLPGLIEALSKEFKVLYNKDVQLLTIRNYNQETIQNLVGDKEVLMEQRSRFTAQFVIKGHVQ